MHPESESTRAGTGRTGRRTRRRLCAALLGVGILTALIPAAAQAAAPTVETKPPGVLRWDRALLGGYVDAGGEPTTYRVEYGETDSYGSSTSATAVGGPSTGTNFAVSSRFVTGLEPSTTYHFRLVATNDSGTATGDDLTFTTPPAPSSRSNRVYEQVSPVDKSGQSIYFGLDTQTAVLPGALSRDGERAVFNSWGLHSGATGGAMTSYRSTRTDTGWVTEPISPPMKDPFGDHAKGYANLLYLTTLDLDADLIATRDSQDPVDTNGFYDLYARPSRASEFELVSRGNEGELITDNDVSQVAIADGGRSVLFASTDELVPGTAVPGERQLYLRRRGHTYHVSELPSGDPATDVSWAKPRYRLQLDDQLNDLAILSDDGSRVTFTSSGQIYQWVEGGGTTWVSEPETSATDQVQLLRSSRDGSKIAFFSSASLLEGAPANGFYEYSSGEPGGELRYLGGHPTGNDFGSVSSVRVVSGDLSAMFYEMVAIGDDGSFWIELRRLSNGIVTTVARAETDFSWTGIVALEGTLQGLPGPAYHVTPDGGGFTFVSSAPLTSYDSGGRQMAYVYSEEHGLQCLSCLSDGKAPTLPPAKDALFSQSQSSTISEDGSRVLFSTWEPLVSQDQNNRIDVYEWHAGQISLLSSGRSGSSSRVVGISADGQDAVFSTFESLVSQDVDGGDLDFYDARIGGGFGPEPPRPPAPCVGDACQGLPPASPPAGGKPGTETFKGVGNLSPAAVRIARVKPVSGAVARLRVRVSGAGRVSVSGSSVRGRSRAASKAGRVELRVSLTSRAKRALRRSGKVVAPLRISFRASDGEVVTRSLSVTFKRPKGGR